MDYVALYHKDERPTPGIHYNTETKIGGVRYYKPKQEQVVESSGNGPRRLRRESREVKVYVDDKKEFELLEKIPKKNEAQEESNKSSDEREFERTSSRDRSKEFVVKIASYDVDFASEGIKPARLKKNDEEWLKKAQYYFLNARENGIKVGSAVQYTTLDILHALWSTAEQTGIDPKRFLVQIYTETRFNPNLRGQAGERGIGQFKKGTAEMLGYDWDKITSGHETYAYQAKCAAEFIAKVGEAQYNGGGARGRSYTDKIGMRLQKIEDEIII